MANPIKICLAQIDVVPGQPRKNMEKMLSVVSTAKDSDCPDLIIFPEMAIPGYILGDMWEREDFLQECEECGERIIEASRGTAIAFGNVKTHPKYRNEDGRVRKYNSCFVASNGELETSVIKTLQPNYREFDDNRHFYDKRKLLMDQYLEMSLTNQTFASGSRDLCTFAEWMNRSYEPSIKINDLKVGFLLCEDGWDTDYTFSPIDVLAPKCDIVVNISCSPFTMGKNGKRNRLFSSKAKDCNTTIVYVNNVGVQNNGKTIYTFDGSSCIYNQQGNQITPYKPFEEGASTFEIQIDDTFGYKESVEEDDIWMLNESLCYGIRRFMENLGIDKVVIGASGGVDSAVAAGLFAQILPKENINLVNMPSKYNSLTTRKLGRELADNIGCNYNEFFISESVELTKRQFEDQGMYLSGFSLENVQARDRSSRLLAAFASHIGGVFTCNANKSEVTVGYTTLYGDLGGFLAPLADVWKSDVYRLASHINSLGGKTIIPQGTMDIVPSAELSAEQDVDQDKGDPLSYEYHDKLFRSWVERWNRATPADILQWKIDGALELELGMGLGSNVIDDYFLGDMKAFIDDLERWWNLYDGFAFAKRIQAPPILAVSRRAFGFDHRESQTSPFYSKKYMELKQELLKWKNDRQE